MLNDILKYKIKYLLLIFVNKIIYFYISIPNKNSNNLVIN